MRTLAMAWIVLIGSGAAAQTTPPTTSQPVQTQPTQPHALRLVQTICLPDVRGRLDHLAIDRKHQQLFVAATDNNTLEVVDLAAGKRLQSVAGFAQPQGVLYLPAQDLLVVTNGGNGLMRFLQRESFKPVDQYKFGDDADDLRYDAATDRIFVGYGDGGVAGFDAARHAWLQDFSVGGHPESFQVESKGKRIFINVPDSPAEPHVAVLLRRDPKPLAILATWNLDGLKKNFPMALDETHRRLFVGCREPAVLATLDLDSGKIVSRTPIDGDADDIFYDATSQRLDISCGAGYLDVLQQQDADHYKVIERLATVPGARTCLLVPEMHRLYLAVPQRASQPAEVRVYETITN